MCQFVFDPNLWPNNVDMMDEPWNCPYPALDGSDYCIFHIHPLIREIRFDSDTQRRFEQIKAIKSTGVIQIVCAVFRNLDLSILSKLAANNFQIQIGYSMITGEINASKTTLDNYVILDDCRVNRINFNRSISNSSLRIQNSSIGHLDLSETEIRGQTTFVATTFDNASFVNSEFDNYISFCQRISDPTPLAEVDENIGKRPCTFEGTPLFMGTQFNFAATFAGVEFKSGANFNHAEFSGGCNFINANFNIGCHFGFATFDKETAFIEADLGTANFEKTEFDGPVLFNKAEFGSGFTYSKLNDIQSHGLSEGIQLNSLRNASNLLDDFVFEDGIVSVAGKAASFDNTEANDLMKIRGANSDNIITAFTAYFYFLDISLQFESSSPTISFFGSEIEGGIFRTSDKNSYYEWVSTTVGDVSIVKNTDKNPFENILIENTRFEGFDFSDYREDLRDIDWQIDGYSHNEEHIPSDDKEATYSKAKSGAEQVGDNYAESKFFIREKRSRRAVYKERMSDSSTIKGSIKEFFKYISNLFYDVSCKYAESPRRVVTWSVGIVFIFAMIYSQLGAEVPYELTIPAMTIKGHYSTPQLVQTEISGLEYLIFSFESFSAFMIGSDVKMTDPVIRLTTSIQAFTGTFLIGLFVATVIRTVKR